VSAEPKLCYVDGNVAYFTTREPFTDQWGDDWNDAPYQCNAGSPNEPCWHNNAEEQAKRGKVCTCDCCRTDWNEDGTPKWEVVKVWWAGPWAPPGYEPYRSVEEINDGACPWLIPLDWSEAKPIIGGTTLSEFSFLVMAGGGVFRRKP